MLSLTHFELDISARGRGIQQLYSILSSNDFKNDIRKSMLLLFARKKKHVVALVYPGFWPVQKLWKIYFCKELAHHIKTNPPI